jgi:hypothetical protein
VHISLADGNAVIRLRHVAQDERGVRKRRNDMHRAFDGKPRESGDLGLGSEADLVRDLRFQRLAKPARISRENANWLRPKSGCIR